MKLLLASKSASRRRMLEAAGVPFEPAGSEFDEEAMKAELRKEGLGAAALAEVLAGRKALAVEADPEALVLGSDQVLEREDGSTLDKASSREHAFEQLKSLSGRAHRLHSAAVVVERGQAAWSFVESVTIRMRPLSDAFLADYLDREYEAVRWSVGAYHLEGRGAQLFERVEGSHFAVLGLPLLPLLGFLRRRGLLTS